ncbi:MAG: polysaccharide pyruvyl transferase family protein [Cyclobacteriaceae bacterium]
MKILLKGYYGFGNLGDDILMCTIYKVVKNRYPTAQFFIFSNYDTDLKGFNRQPDYNKYIHKLFGEQLTIINWTYRGEFDLVFDGGGGVYFDSQKRSKIRTLLNESLIRIGANHVYRFDKFIRWITGRKRHIRFKRRMGFGIGIGPYSRSSIMLYRHLVEIGSTDVLFVRDKTSLEFLNLINYVGVKGLCADVAFLWAAGLEKPVRAKPKEPIDKIGIILLDWPDGDDSRFSEFQKFADKQIDVGKSVTFFSFDENADKRYSSIFESKYNYEVWRPNDMTLNEFLATLSLQDILFSARAHGVIIGAIYGVPSVCIVVSPKLLEISKMIPLGTSIIGDHPTVAILEEELSKANLTYGEMLNGLRQNVLANVKLGLTSWELFSKEL